MILMKNVPLPSWSASSALLWVVVQGNQDLTGPPSFSNHVSVPYWHCRCHFCKKILTTSLRRQNIYFSLVYDMAVSLATL